MQLRLTITIDDDAKTAEALFDDGERRDYPEDYRIATDIDDTNPDGLFFGLTSSDGADFDRYATWPEAESAFRRVVADQVQLGWKPEALGTIDEDA